MAPSFDVGNPQRSLVRIPGSGEDRTLKPICLEVAQISSFSKSLSEITNCDFSIPPELAISGTINVTPPPGFGSSASTTEEPPGRNTERAQELENATGRKRASDEDLSNTAKKSATSDSHPSNTKLSANERTEKIKRLTMEKNQLEDENNELKKKLAMFKEIIRSRSKLKEFQTALQELSSQG